MFTRCLADCGSHTEQRYTALLHESASQSRCQTRTRIRLGEIYLFAVKSSLLKRYSHGFRKSATHNSISSGVKWLSSSSKKCAVLKVVYTFPKSLYRYLENNMILWVSMQSFPARLWVFVYDKLPYYQKKLNIY